MYVADTHAWIYYLLDKLPAKSDEIFKSAEHGDIIMFVPTIVICESIYLVESGKVKLNFTSLFSKFEKSNNFIVVPLNFGIVKALPNIALRELHDRIIVATAKLLDMPLVTKDKEIVKSDLIKTIW